MEKSKVLAAINRAFPNFLIVENEKTIALNDDSCICFKSRLIDNDFVGFVYFGSIKINNGISKFTSN